MINCNYCQKEYKINGIKIHQNKCKQKNNDININIKKNDNNTNIVTNLFNKIPDDILIYIKSFLFIKKDDFCSFRMFHKNLINFTITSKRFFNLFYPNSIEHTFLKNNLIEESKLSLCKSNVVSKYPIKNSELDNDIQCSLVKNPHYKYGAPMKIYKISNILDFLYKKYQSKKMYDELEEKKDELKIKRLNIYNLLFEQYKLDKNVSLYQENYSFVSRGTPGIKNIENKIKNYFEIILRKEELNKYIRSNNLKLYDINIVKEYINENKYNLEFIIDKLKECKIREELLYNELLNNNISLKEQKNNEYISSKIHDFINYNKYSHTYISEQIVGKRDRKNNLIIELKKNGLKLRNDSEICQKYIDNNEYDLDYVVNTMVEMNFYYSYTNYSNIFQEEKREADRYYDSDEGRYVYDYIEVSNISKQRALTKWCSKYSSYEIAIENNVLPKSLYNKVEQYFNNFIYKNKRIKK